MKMQHKSNHGWGPNRNDPEWEERVEREAKATTDATEKAWKAAQKRLAKAQERWDRLAAQGAEARRLEVAEQMVMLRLAELQEIERLMTRSPAGSSHRGRKSHRHIPAGRGGVL